MSATLHELKTWPEFFEAVCGEWCQTEESTSPSAPNIVARHPSPLLVNRLATIMGAP